MYPTKGFIYDWMFHASGLQTNDLFRFWVGVSLVAAAVRRNVQLKSTGGVGGYEALDVFPNLYLILVAPPAKAKKSTLMREGRLLLKGNPYVNVITGSLTPQALVSTLKHQYSLGNLPITDFNGYISASEFGMLVSKESHNERMLATLCDVYDGGESGQHTVSRGKERLENAAVTIVAAITPKGLATQMPPHFFQTGFDSRCLFIYADNPDKLAPYPGPPTGAKAVPDLQKDLEVIAQSAVVISEDAAALAWYEQWYIRSFHAPKHPDIPEDYYSRRETHLKKLAINMVLSEGRDLILDADYIQALEILEATEAEMPKAFAFIGIGYQGQMVSFVREVMMNKQMRHGELMRRVQTRMSLRDLEEALNTLVVSEEVQYKDGLVTWVG